MMTRDRARFFFVLKSKTKTAKQKKTKVQMSVEHELNIAAASNQGQIDVRSVLYWMSQFILIQVLQSSHTISLKKGPIFGHCEKCVLGKFRFFRGTGFATSFEALIVFSHRFYTFRFAHFLCKVPGDKIQPFGKVNEVSGKSIFCLFSNFDFFQQKQGQNLLVCFFVISRSPRVVSDHKIAEI